MPQSCGRHAGWHGSPPLCGFSCTLQSQSVCLLHSNIKQCAIVFAHIPMVLSNAKHAWQVLCNRTSSKHIQAVLSGLSCLTTGQQLCCRYDQGGRSAVQSSTSSANSRAVKGGGSKDEEHKRHEIVTIALLPAGWCCAAISYHLDMAYTFVQIACLLVRRSCFESCLHAVKLHAVFW